MSRRSWIAGLVNLLAYGRNALRELFGPPEQKKLPASQFEWQLINLAIERYRVCQRL